MKDLVNHDDFNKNKILKKNHWRKHAHYSLTSQLSSCSKVEVFKNMSGMVSRLALHLKRVGIHLSYDLHSKYLLACKAIHVWEITEMERTHLDISLHGIFYQLPYSREIGKINFGKSHCPQWQKFS